MRNTVCNFGSSRNRCYFNLLVLLQRKFVKYAECQDKPDDSSLLRGINHVNGPRTCSQADVVRSNSDGEALCDKSASHSEQRT